MDEWTVIAYAAFGLSSFISALRIGRWLRDADPKLVVSAGRCALVCLTLCALGVFAWLIANGRWTHALMLAAFIMPVIVEAAPHWRGLLRPIGILTSNLSLVFRSREKFRSKRGTIDPDLVEQSAAVLKAYLDQTRREVIRLPSEFYLPRGPMNGFTQESAYPRMSAMEALDVLGLHPNPSADEIGEAHRRLREKLDPDLGGTSYLLMKINEAKEVLLGG
jgi:hypothetical protein